MKILHTLNSTYTLSHRMRLRVIGFVLSVAFFGVLPPSSAIAVSFSLDLTTIGCGFCSAGTFKFAMELLPQPNQFTDRQLVFQGPQSITTIDYPFQSGSNVAGTLQYASNGNVPFAPDLIMVSPTTFPFPGGPPRSLDGILIASVTLTDRSASTYSLDLSETRIGRQPLRIDMETQAFTFKGSVPTNSVPVPASTLLFFAPGLLGLAGYRWWQYRPARSQSAPPIA